MIQNETIINLLLFFGLIYSAFVVIFCNKIAFYLGVIDHPGTQEHNAHKTPTPLAGGLVALPPTILILFVQYFQSDAASAHATSYLGIAFATLASLLVGYSDDRSHIPALTRLIVCSGIFCASISIEPNFIVSALDFQGIEFKVEMGLIAIPFSIFCLLAFQNAVNMADGRNGLVAGMVIMWLLALLSYGWHPVSLAIVSLIIGMLVALGANLGGRLFLGDAGTYGIGAFVGLSTIWIHQSNIGLQTIDVVIMFMVPILDMARLFVSRIFNGRHPFSADHGHLHHHLDGSIGWFFGRKIYYGLVATPILLTRFKLTDPAYALIIGLALYSFAFAVARANYREA
jgi:UDP-GlcNAc:undecaprenyl-phosphate GlcNAc-1-phosphate transferase